MRLSLHAIGICGYIHITVLLPGQTGCFGDPVLPTSLVDASTRETH